MIVKNLRLGFLLISIVILFLIGFFLGKVYFFQKPFIESDIPQWGVEEMNEGKWKLYSIDEPNRHTLAWLERGPKSEQCDTLVLMGGLDDGKNLAVGANHLKKRANLISIRHPLNQLIESNPWQSWAFKEWLFIPGVIKNEMAHTIGALRAVANYSNSSKRKDLRFSNKVILAGGSFGGPFPVMLTSFDPKSVTALAVIYSFTNYELVITRELTRQGLIHFKLEKEYKLFTDPGLWLKRVGVKVLGRALGFLLGNMLKYGYMEYYFPNIQGVPTFFINGLEDNLVPREAFDPMWESASQPKYQEWIKGDHIQPGEDWEVKRVIDSLYKWAQSQQLWNCRNYGDGY